MDFTKSSGKGAKLFQNYVLLVNSATSIFFFISLLLLKLERTWVFVIVNVGSKATILNTLTRDRLNSVLISA